MLTTLLFILSWLLLGHFVCTKKNWYNHENNEDKQIAITLTLVLSPLFLVFNLIKVFIIEDWKNE